MNLADHVCTALRERCGGQPLGDAVRGFGVAHGDAGWTEVYVDDEVTVHCYSIKLIYLIIPLQHGDATANDALRHAFRLDEAFPLADPALLDRLDAALARHRTFCALLADRP